MQKQINDTIQFIQLFTRHYQEIGTLFPTSSYAGRAMADELARRRGQNRRILEVGSGTGAMTVEIAPQLRAGDELHLCEINSELVEVLRQRIETEPVFAGVRDQIFIHEMSVLDVKADRPFDVIISSLPFNVLPFELTQEIIAYYRRVLAPDGTFTYIEYIGGRTLKSIFTPSAEADEVQRFMGALQTEHSFRREVVFMNLPPAWIHHLRLSAPEATDAHKRHVAPREQIGWGAFRFDRDALFFVLGILGLSSLLRRRWLALLAVPVALFFRDPKREIVADDTAVLAGADGKVMAIEKMHDSRFGEGEWCRIVVFLSIFDVHVNRAPVAGKVVDRLSQGGGFAVASSAEADHNVAEFTVIETVHGRCVVAQRVGAVARRLVNRAPVDSLLAQGEKFGLMRFGSRMDIYLPADGVEPLVTVGQTVQGGITPIARWK